MKLLAIPVLILVTLSLQPARSQAGAPFVAMGDSITEGVQSADSNLRTQPNNWATLVAQQMGVPFPLPLIRTSPQAGIMSTAGRTRISPQVSSPDLGVSGATIHDLLYTAAAQPISTETSLVLSPRYGQTQMSIAQSLNAPLYGIWIGNNDVDGAILSWSDLDASQMTSIADFTSDFAKMISLLKSMYTRVVIGTIPDVTKIGFVFSPSDLKLFTGSDCGLRQGSYTTGPTALLLKQGLVGCSILLNPSFVLDPSEIAAIQLRLRQFNQIITADATAAGFGVVDVYGLFQQIEQTPPTFFGVPLTVRFNGGLLSLDGVHPSDIGHALSANAFIQTANQRYGLNIPLLTQDQLNTIAAADPFIDWNGNLIVRGRPLAGELETLGPSLGISGDFTDAPPTAAVSANALRSSKVNPALGQAFKQQYLTIKGRPLSTQWTEQDAIAAMKDVFSHLQ
jgi:lysophospholipase L1-like esterase